MKKSLLLTAALVMATTAANAQPFVEQADGATHRSFAVAEIGAEREVHGVHTLRLIVYDEQCVAVRTKLEAVLHSEVVRLHHEVVAAEGAGLHEECRVRMIEVRDHRVGKSEVIRWEDELIGPAIVLLQHTVGANGCLRSLHHACTHSTHMVSGTLCVVHQLAAVGIDAHLLRVHLVLCEVLHLYVVEVAQSAVERNVCEVDATYLHALHQLTREVQAGSRSRNRTLVFSKDALEVVEVVLSAALIGTAVYDVAWQRSLAQTVELALELVEIGRASCRERV